MEPAVAMAWGARQRFILTISSKSSDGEGQKALPTLSSEAPAWQTQTQARNKPLKGPGIQIR
jgi:hypothetical protein